jgi:hypothetical protein
MRIVVLVAGALALAGCVGERGAFDCARPGASCGDTPGAVCVDGLCAVPSGDCPSGLEYADNAGDKAGQCVPGGVADAGPDAPLGCGNGMLDMGEDCDGDKLGGKDCEALGYTGGTLACTGGCEYDTSACVAPPGCGDGLIGPMEECDKTNVGAATCQGQGFVGGTIGCTPACKLDTSGCTNCGNDTANPGEDCDGADLAGKGCSDVGFDEGTLACTSSCTFDTAACVKCGDGAAEGSEQCDGMDLGDKDCAMLGYAGGTLKCNAASCTYDTTMCVAPPNCPNGQIDASEQCDGANLGGGSCASATGGLKPSGTLGCNGACQWDTSGCYACGDGLVNAVEMCDGTNFAGETCVGRGHDGGSLTCAMGCLAICRSSPRLAAFRAV